MLTDLFPVELFTISPTAIAGTSLWALALYIGFSPISDWLMQQLVRWFNFAERPLYSTQEEYERTRIAREAQNAFYASFFSIFPFLAVGILCNVGIEWSLGNSWAISTGILACIGCGIYDLGRRSS